MGWFGDDHDATQAYGNYQDANQASVTHELLGGAAAYEAAKAYENHCAANGQPTSHAKAKELLAGFAGAYVDREVETKGFDYIDREKAKRAAQQYTDEELGGADSWGQC